MCGRFTLFEPDKILSREFSVSGFPTLSPRHNIAPSQPVTAVRATPAGAGRELALLRWERGKQPYFVRMHDAHLFAFAGLWDRWESPEEGVIETCTILTIAANADDKGCIAPLP